MNFYCPVTEEPLEKLGSNRGNPVFYCRRHDAKHEMDYHKYQNVILGKAPCPKERRDDAPIIQRGNREELKAH
jgi:hypothetical protein